jgi:hypothetical protein
MWLPGAGVGGEDLTARSVKYTKRRVARIWFGAIAMSPSPSFPRRRESRFELFSWKKWCARRILSSARIAQAATTLKHSRTRILKVRNSARS